MRYTSYDSVCELEARIVSAEDLDFIETGGLDGGTRDIAKIERMLKALIKSLKTNP